MFTPDYHAYRNDILQNNSRRQLILPPDEYAHVMHELNTHLSEQDRHKKLVVKPIGNYYYLFWNRRFNDYIIIGKYKIDDVLDAEFERSPYVIRNREKPDDSVKRD